MVRHTESGEIVFKCPCGEEVKGAPYDARVGGIVVGSSETTDLYKRLIRSAPYDPVNQKVMCPPCPDCGRDYVAQLRISLAEVVIHRCKCGRESSGASDLQDSAPLPESLVKDAGFVKGPEQNIVSQMGALALGAPSGLSFPVSAFAHGS
jgi:hypothetical protein